MSHYTIYPLDCGTMIRGSEKLGMHFNPGVPFTYPILSWYLTNGEHHILIDTGGPPDCPVKQPHYRTEEQRIDRALERLGVSCEQIETVLFTHLHWDHSSNNNLFPNASFYVQKRELEYAVAPLEIHRLTYCHWEKLFQTHFYLLEGDEEILDGIRCVFTPGHTPGSQSVAVDTEDGVFVLISDLTNLNQFWEEEPKIANGIHHDLSDTYESFAKVAKIADYVLTGHDPQILEYKSFPNGEFPRKEQKKIIWR